MTEATIKLLRNTIRAWEQKSAEQQKRIAEIAELAEILHDYEGVFSLAAKHRIDKIYELSKPKEGKT